VSQPEAELTRAIIDALNATGWCWVMRHNGGRRGHQLLGLGKGAADIVGMMRDGRFVALEVKMPKGKPARPEQIQWLDRVAFLNGVTGVVRSVEEALQVVDAARRVAA
jgi:hypothetical protein